VRAIAQVLALANLPSRFPPIPADPVEPKSVAAKYLATRNSTNQISELPGAEVPVMSR